MFKLAWKTMKTIFFAYLLILAMLLVGVVMINITLLTF